jgi:hypothetical protein
LGAACDAELKYLERKKVKGELRLCFFSTQGAQAGARGTARFYGKLDMFHTKSCFIF